MSTSIPSCAAMLKAIYYKVQIVMPSGVKVSPHWRVQGDSLPAVTYELVSCDWWNTINDGNVNVATLTVNWACIDMTQSGALALADLITNTLAAKQTYDSITFGATSISYRAADQAPDDGSGDRDRVILVTTTIYAADQQSGGAQPEG